MSAEPKRKRGRPPGPCPTPYQRSLVLQVAKVVGVPARPEPARIWTAEEQLKIRAFDRQIFGDRGVLLPAAWAGHPAALLELERRFGLILYVASGQPLLAGGTGWGQCRTTCG